MAKVIAYQPVSFRLTPVLKWNEPADRDLSPLVRRRELMLRRTYCHPLHPAEQQMIIISGLTLRRPMIAPLPIGTTAAGQYKFTIEPRCRNRFNTSVYLWKKICSGTEVKDKVDRARVLELTTKNMIWKNLVDCFLMINFISLTEYYIDPLWPFPLKI